MKFKLASLLLGIAAAAMAKPGKIGKELLNVNSPAPVQAIVRYSSSPGASSLNLVAAKGGKLVKHIPLINAVTVALPGNAVSDVAADPQVEFISSDRPVRGSMDYTEPSSGADLAFRSGWDGTGTTIAVLDSGINRVPDLNGKSGKAPSRVIYQESFLTPSPGPGDPYGHGTHVAGIIAGNGFVSAAAPSGKVLRGIAPDANLVDLQVLDQNGMSSDSIVIAALSRVIELKDAYNIRT